MDSILSQEEINALLSGIENGTIPTNNTVSLTPEEEDAIGEISNISMGTAATTLSQIVNKKVIITTPKVEYATWEDIEGIFNEPGVTIDIMFREGLSGNNLLLLKERDVRVITDLMMGGTGTNVDDVELSELHMSAISEAMNQMMGAASTAMSSMLERKIDISPPTTIPITDSSSVANESSMDFLKDTFVKVSFKLEIEGLIDSQLMQMYPMDFAKELFSTFSALAEADAAPKEAPKEEPKKEQAPQPEPQPQPQPQPQPMQQVPGMDMQQYMMGNMQQGMPPNMMYQMPGMQMPPNGMYQQPGFVQQNINVAPAQFAAFNQAVNPALQTENIDLIMDVPLEVTVELGRTTRSIHEILEFKPGTIVELNKLAGEPVDVLVNGKFVAKGEVVVIDECFGIRITEITK